MTSIYDFKLKTIDDKTITLQEYKEKTLLIVNVASKCGFTNQYQELEELYTKYKDKGLVILGIPCNQFGSQEPGSNEEVAEFCQLNYNVSFPMFSKIDVNGEQADPLYKFLTKEQTGILGSERIKWNFTKFLITKEGNVLKRFAPTKTPLSFENKIKSIL